jgi:hypothetical protein
MAEGAQQQKDSATLFDGEVIFFEPGTPIEVQDAVVQRLTLEKRAAEGPELPVTDPTGPLISPNTFPGPPGLTGTQVTGGDLVGNAEALKQIVGQVGGDIFGGATGALGLAFSSGDLDLANQIFEKQRSHETGFGSNLRTMLFEPRISPQAAEEFGAGITAPLEAAVEKVDRFAESPFGATVSPEVSTLLKTGILGGASLLGIKRTRSSPTDLTQLAAEGNALGLKFNPKDVQGGAAGAGTRALEGAAGLAKLNKRLSFKNMKGTTQAINDQLGIPSNPAAPTRITPTRLRAYKKEHGKAYRPIETFTDRRGLQFRADQEYLKQYDVIRQSVDKLDQQAPAFSPSQSYFAKLNDLDPRRFSNWDGDVANQILKDIRESTSKAFDAGDNLEGLALQRLGKIYQDMLDRNMVRAGEAEAVADMAFARKKIAQAEAVHAALPKRNSRGAIDAGALAAQEKLGVPLTGNLKKLAEIADAFPEVMRNVDIEPIFSEFEALAGGPALIGGLLGLAGAAPAAGAAALTGAGVIAAKPLARAFLSSGAGQRLNLPAITHPLAAPALGTTGLLIQDGIQRQGLLGGTLNDPENFPPIQ